MIRLLALVLGLANVVIAPSKGQAEETRSVTGSLTYKQEIALPPGSRAQVKAKGRFGVILGEVELDRADLRMPRSFSVEVPPGVSGALWALITVNDAPRWIVDGVGFPAGNDTIALGQVVLRPVTPLDFAKGFVCGDIPVSIGVLNEEMTLSVEGRDISLKRVQSEDGARYETSGQSDTRVWKVGEEITVTLDGSDLPECRKMPPPAERPYRARGNEPGWHVSLAGQIADVVVDYGALSRNVPRPEARAVPGGYEFDISSADAHLRIEERMCHDDMSGMPYPDTTQLTLDGRKLNGCGGDPADLLTGGAWRITALGDAELVEPERLSLNFFDGGRVAGSGGCNRMAGGFSLSGEGMNFGPMVSTMMACPEPLMEQERRMLDALEQVIAFDVDADGQLRLLAEDRRTVLIEAARP